ncbi:hypothetical protein A1359_03170 [Methylomonas lenta]|uniref:Histidine kinase n=1 Tax=Methylomonas lenta TaxID=980561 RepID=A0A177NSC9_9GAMM|nr:hypothetical protein [Methylomonas lenta]OAI20474.1 hypothetical protein A1359_03170 [Methylomonas lenta]
MKRQGLVSIKVALYGMDPRSHKTMELYLKGPCRGIAEVVPEADAEIDIIDADFATAGEILQTRRQQTPERPILLLSLEFLKIENTYFVQKPVNAEQLTAVLSKIVSSKKPKQLIEPEQPVTTLGVSPAAIQDAIPQENTDTANPSPKATKSRKTFANNEGGYTAFLGTLSDIDFSDPEQLQRASFDAKSHLLGYVLSAFKVACHQGKTQQLNSIWKPILIFPDTRQIWLDADDKQLRVFAGIEQNHTFAGKISLLAVDAAISKIGLAADKFQDIDVFIWKLTIWTSKGRFPASINLQQAVYLKHWPNFTRLLLTPDAMRIAALLLKDPRTPLQLANLLNIKPQYVFAFISACNSLDILGQCQRSADFMVVPEVPKPSKKQNLFSKILNKLRGD